MLVDIVVVVVDVLIVFVVSVVFDDGLVADSLYSKSYRTAVI